MFSTKREAKSGTCRGPGYNCPEVCRPDLTFTICTKQAALSRAYQLKDIEIVASPAKGVLSVNRGLTPASKATVNTVAALFGFVKSHDPDYNQKPVSRNVNTDGTPRVVCHGTNRDFNIRGNEFQKSEKKLTEQVGDLFRRIGNKVFRNRLGDGIIDRRGVKTDIAHGIGRAKAATFAAVPAVIKNGKQTDFRKNWKNRGYDPFFAAPVEMAENPTYVAAVVTSRENNQFYLHEMEDEEGSVICKIDAPTTIQTGITEQNGITGGVGASTEQSVPQPAETVKGLRLGEVFEQNQNGGMTNGAEGTGPAAGE